jgi:hypothetical protein
MMHHSTRGLNIAASLASSVSMRWLENRSYLLNDLLLPRCSRVNRRVVVVTLMIDIDVHLVILASLLLVMLLDHLLTVLIFHGRPLTARDHSFHNELMAAHLLSLLVLLLLQPGIVTFLGLMLNTCIHHMMFLLPLHDIVKASDICRLLPQQGRIVLESLVIVIILLFNLSIPSVVV